MELIKTLAKELTHEYGNGYSQRYLAYFRKFYLTMPDLTILQTRLQNLKWSVSVQNRRIASIKSSDYLCAVNIKTNHYVQQ